MHLSDGRMHHVMRAIQTSQKTRAHHTITARATIGAAHANLPICLITATDLVHDIRLTRLCPSE